MDDLQIRNLFTKMEYTDGLKPQNLKREMPGTSQTILQTRLIILLLNEHYFPTPALINWQVRGIKQQLIL